jgi:hypothetical protein
MSNQLLRPFPHPDSGQDRVDKLTDLIRELWGAVQYLQESIMVPQKAAPVKVREGLIRYADGVNWNPGSGAGLYQYISGSWVKL